MANPLSAFLPPWRFGSNVRMADDTDLESLSDGAVVAEWCFAALVVIGVGGEFSIAARHFPNNSWIGWWGPAYADLLVAIGVAGEVFASVIAHLCQSELTRRTNEKLAETSALLGSTMKYAVQISARSAEAQERAAKAELETEQLKKRMAKRILTKEQFETIRDELKGKVRTVVGITTSGHTEARQYADQISRALHLAGIASRIFSPRIGVTWTELYVAIPTPIPDLSTDPIFSAFRKAGLSVGCGHRGGSRGVSMTDLPNDIPIIMVGEKHVPYESVPYVMGLPPSSAWPIPKAE
jgi:hypothetical protein